MKMIYLAKWARVAGAVALVAACAVPASISAQGTEGGRPGPRAVLDRDREIALARSAAPSEVSKDATVLAWNGRTFEVAAKGSNGVTCYVGRSWPTSIEPHCFDEEGARTILPIHLRQTELWAQGADREAIDAEIAEGLRTGTFRLPSRPALSYMMSAGQDLIDDDGNKAGSWRPHLMLYYPWLTSEGMGLGSTPSLTAGVVVDPGTPLSNLMIVVDDFVQVETGSR